MSEQLAQNYKHYVLQKNIGAELAKISICYLMIAARVVIISGRISGITDYLDSLFFTGKVCH